MSITHLSGPLALGAGSVEVLDAATTLTAKDNGKTFFLDAAAGATITLMPLKAGTRVKFVVTSAFATSNWIVASSEGGNISGSVIVAGAQVTAAEEDQINFVATAELVGDFIEVIADTTNSQWLVSGVGGLTGGITATAPA